jgi:uroporphyrinogen-III synthase
VVVSPLGPLAGRTVAVTRAAEQAGPLVTRLEALGAEVFEVPLIAIADPIDGGAALHAAVASLDTYDWVVLTSPNAARRFLDTIPAAAGLPKIAAVGPGTAQVVLDRGHVVDLIPMRVIGEGLVEAFARGPGRVLFPRAEVARVVVAEGLTDKGWTVDVVDAYRTVPAPVTPDHVRALLTADVVVLTSSSTATATAAALAGAIPKSVVSMGIATTLTANNIGLPVAITADPSTIDGLLAACVACVAAVQRD